MDMGEELEWDVNAAIQFVTDSNSRNVALQFPHDLIPSAHRLLCLVTNGLKACGWTGNVFLLADVARHGTTVDVVAAEHLQADSIVQFGSASREPVRNIPVFHVLRKQPYDFSSLLAHVTRLAGSTGKELVVILDNPYAHLQEQLSEASMKYGVQVCKSPFEILKQVSGPTCADGHSEVGSSTWTGDCHQHRLWVGPSEDNSTLDYALVACGTTDWTFLDPATDTMINEIPTIILKRLMRRRFLVSKAENALIVGILISTVAIDGWKDVLEQVKSLARAVEKKTYTVFLGKPAPEKLANFPEVEVWVQISDPAGFVWDSKPYLAPVVSPAEAAQAWQPLVPHISESSQDKATTEHSTAVACQPSPGSLTAVAPGGALIIQPRTAAEFFLQKRTFTGVETPATGAPTKVAEPVVPGLLGRAAGYNSEARP